MIIITAGDKYTDIDALASCYAYKKLKDLQVAESLCVLPGPLNESVTKSMQNWEIDFETNPPQGDEFEYVVIDVSEPKNFSKFVEENKVIELYDHHFGFEEYWHKKLGNKAQIEKIGACATQIWEKYKEAGLDTKIDTLSANLLYTTIISHTLNFKVGVTTQRDVQAVEELKKYTDLPSDWIKTYFEEVEEALLTDPVNAMIHDTKIQNINNKNYFVIQLELWDSKKFVKDNLHTIKKQLNTSAEDIAFFTSPSISEGKNYIIARDEYSRKTLEKIVGVNFDSEIGTTNRLFLRKELFKMFIDSKMVE